ncbi:hypothetical protein [Aeromicrobium sp. Leaf350]|uniref:hypothetical protein n=1 Tax=Aeromicrobium sp. Leaf350 TaxID=2876565 RepID=UPI001E2DA1A3|nr:hypothetical protein [Aeromicrobium sp. Leaf350]
MNDLYEARIRIEKVDTVTSELRRRLTIAYEELLEVERMGDRSDVGLLVIDRADDLRRLLSGSLRDLTQPIRPALEVAENAYLASAISGEIDASHARTMIGVVLQSARETRSVQLAINDAARSLQPAVTASPADPWLPERLNRSLQQTSRSLDDARRGAHRLGEDLPMVARSLGVDIASLDIAENLSIASLADRHRAPCVPEHQPARVTTSVTSRGVTP